MEILNDFKQTPCSKSWSTIFLVESNKIENASITYKIVTSEANAKAKKMVVKIGPITKNRVLPVPILFFSKFYFSLRTFIKS